MISRSLSLSDGPPFRVGGGETLAVATVVVVVVAALLLLLCYFVYNIIASLSSALCHVVSDPTGQINTIVLVTMAKSCDSLERFGEYLLRSRDFVPRHRLLPVAVVGSNPSGIRGKNWENFFK